MNRKIIWAIAFMMTLIPINSKGIIVPSFTQYMKSIEVPVDYYATCTTEDGINFTILDYHNHNSEKIYLDSMRLIMHRDGKFDSFTENYIKINFDEAISSQNGGFIYRKYNKNNRNQYIQVYANPEGLLLVSAYYDGKYNDSILFGIDLQIKENKNRYAVFLNSDQLQSQFPKEEGRKLSEDEQERLRKEEKKYRELLTGEAEKAASKFGL